MYHGHPSSWKPKKDNGNKHLQNRLEFVEGVPRWFMDTDDRKSNIQWSVDIHEANISGTFWGTKQHIYIWENSYNVFFDSAWNQIESNGIDENDSLKSWRSLSSLCCRQVVVAHNDSSTKWMIQYELLDIDVAMNYEQIGGPKRKCHPNLWNSWEPKGTPPNATVPQEVRPY